MITEDYDHRWEPLAEVHFSVDSKYSDENYTYCLCSRVFLRDGVKLYYADDGDGSESDVDVLQDIKHKQWEEHSHVHFSNDTSYKVKDEKDDGASCYCSASHTDNYYSTDEHDAIAPLHTLPRALQPSDSGADLTYQDGHSESQALSQEQATSIDDQSVLGINQGDFVEMEEDPPSIETADVVIDENYLIEDTWEKYWSRNGERLIWASWIKKYSDYINPSYLDESSSLAIDDAGISKKRSVDQINMLADPFFQPDECNDDSVRERKFSFDSKVNPYKKSKSQNTTPQKFFGKCSSEFICDTDETWTPVARQRSCSEHDRMLSPRTLATTDSMTNVTKITVSSYDMTSSHITSESSRSDDYSVSSSSSADQSNDQTRVANPDDYLENVQVEEMESDQYWQFLWKKHFGEQYELHFANFAESHVIEANKDYLPQINVEMASEELEKGENECENSDGNSQEWPSVVEVQQQVTKIKLTDSEQRHPKKKNKKSHGYLGSVGVLLQNLLKEEQNKTESEALHDADNKDSTNKTDSSSVDMVDSTTVNVENADKKSSSMTNFSPQKWNDGEDEPPEKRPINLKRSHETDEEIAAEKIKSTFVEMGLSWNSAVAPKGLLVYRKRAARLRPPRPRRPLLPKKTYFDEEGRPCAFKQDTDSHVTHKEMQSDEDYPQEKSDEDEPEVMPPDLSADTLGTDLNALFSDIQESADLVEQKEICDTDTGLSGDNNSGLESMKRKRRRRRRSPMGNAVQIPKELSGDPKMKKYWKRRHSLFHRFDEGIMLDRESWFSVTPEKVAKHLAERCRCDLIVDGFCGAGGNAIQFAWTCERVIAIDIDPAKIAMAKHNAAVYGVADRIEFIVGDFFALANTLKGDVVFLSPPWGGPQYTENAHYDLESMLEPKPSSELMAAAENISNNIALFVPRTSRSEQLISLAKTSGAVEIEQNFLGRRFVALTAYYGDLVNY